MVVKILLTKFVYNNSLQNQHGTRQGKKEKKMTSITIIKNKISSQNSVPADASFRG